MATTHGTRAMTDMEIYNDLPVVKPMKDTWILDGKIYKVVHRDKAAGLVTLLNKHDMQQYTILWSDFIKNRKRAYPIRRVSDLLNRHYTWFVRQVWKGVFFDPIYHSHDGKKPPPGSPRYMSRNPVYSEDDVFKIREIMVEGRYVTKNGFNRTTYIPTVQELRRRMGLDMLTYTKTLDGRFIPIWEETVHDW